MGLQSHIQYNYRLEILENSWSEQNKTLFSQQVAKVIVNYVEKTIEIWSRQPITKIMHELILRLLEEPIRSMQLIALEGDKKTPYHTIYLKNVNLKDHQVRYDYSTSDITYHYLMFQYEEVNIKGE